MSIQGIRYALAVPGLNASERLVFTILADRADKDGNCFPSQAWIAKHTGLSIRTVIRSLKGLEKLGHIDRKKRSCAAGRTSDFIALRLPTQGAKMAGTKVPNRQTIPTSPYGVGKREEKSLAKGLVLISGGKP